jgi:hypothetical protein
VSFFGRLVTVTRISRRSTYAVLVALFSFLLLAPVVPLLAQDDDVEQLEQLQRERDRVAQEAAVAVGQIDVVTATVEEVTAALDELDAYVSLQRIRLEEAQGIYDAARQAIDDARAGQERVAREAEIVRAHLTDLALSSFTGEGSASGDDMTQLILSDDPGESARFIHLLELQTGSLSDGIDHLRSLELEAEQLVEAEASAVAEAREGLAVVDERVALLDEALATQERVVTGAQIRLESQIAEVAILQERDVELATKIRDQQASINQRIAVSGQTNGVRIPSPVDLANIVRLDFYADVVLPVAEIDPVTGEEIPVAVPVAAEPFFSIEVHKDIAEQTNALFERAFDVGLDLGGWGYRPIQRQIELRAAHCGGSNFDIWHKPVFECAPPTARPGFSKHEQGRAIDFTFNGSSIQSQDNRAFMWLAKNAPAYGFVNLDAEPWHWSIASGDERLPDQ